MIEKHSLPLNDAQARRLSITFAGLEWDLHLLRQSLGRTPHDLLLNHFADPIPLAVCTLIEGLIGQTEDQLHKMAEELGLEPSVEPIRRAFIARLESASIDLSEIRPSSGLRGYGEVPVATTRYLEEKLPSLEDSLRQIIRILESAPSNRAPGS